MNRNNPTSIAETSHAKRRGRKLLHLYSKVALLGFLSLLSHNADARSGEDSLRTLMPVPHTVEAAEGRLRIGKGFTVAVVGAPDDRIYSGASRFVRRLDNRTGLFLSQHFVTPETPDDGATLVIDVERPGKVELGEDESYRLVVNDDGARLRAETDLGALRGLETILQLLSADAKGYYFPGVVIEDEPRFPWRGLMIDSARHFMPMAMIKRNLDGMAAVKLNVMHWHLTDDQGFRVESKTYPRLHEMGSDGLYYTQNQVREIIEYAAERGIRVYPEFDVPGHATAWLVSHPELGSAPGPYEIERGWGIFDPALDPTKEVVYEVLDGLFGEMAELFTDEYFHIGGDEVNGVHWDANPEIQAFMQEDGIADNHELQNHFNQRILKILTKHDKKMIGWDEILQPGMPKNIVIHSWRGRDAMVAAAKDGYSSILSNGYYIDLMHPASVHYLNDPLPVGIDLTEEERERVLGGEATMWSEHVTVETVDSRIWPRTAAVAERLWSAREVNDVQDMYRRLDTISIQLEEHGLTHIKNRGMMMRRLAGGRDIEPIRVLADVVEPLKVYRRNQDLSYRSFSPYTLLPDVATADARDARRFNLLVDEYFKNGDDGIRAKLLEMLESWEANHDRFAALAEKSPALREALEISSALQALARLGQEALQNQDPSDWNGDSESILAEAREPVAKVELQIVDAVERLVSDVASP